MQTHADCYVMSTDTTEIRQKTLQLSDKFKDKVSPSIQTQMASTEVNGTRVLTL